VTLVEQHIQNSVHLYWIAESRKDDLSSYRRIFADFFVGAAAAEAHWYSIKTLHDGIPPLASLLGMSQENLNILLVLSGFGSLRTNGILIFQKGKFASFINKNCLQYKCELAQRQPKGFTNQCWFINVGAKYWANAVAPGSWKHSISRSKLFNIELYFI
jgi:hypothetical protein